jgi:uncharacterized delta-60 repeat protein
MNRTARLAQIFATLVAIGSTIGPVATAGVASGAVSHRLGDERSAPVPAGTEKSRGRVFGAIDGPRGTALVLQPGRAGVAVARYLPDGQLDRSFGRNGIAFDPRTNFYLEGHLATGPGGTVVASSSEGITRFTAAGKVDRTYAREGKIPRDHSPSEIGLATNVVLRNGATIVVSPKFTVKEPLGIVAVRYRPDGRVDQSYGNDGRGFAPLPNDYEPVGAVSLQAGGLLIASVGEEEGELFLARLAPDGTLDRSFAVGGLAAVRGLKGGPIGMVQQPDGGIVIATSGNQFVRFGPTGKRDRAFGTHGVVVGPAPQTTLHSLVEAPEGDLIAAGAALEGDAAGGPTALAVERLSATGSVDQGFGRGTGYVTTSLGPDQRAGVRAVVALPGGRLFLAGQVGDPKTLGAKIVLAGLEADGTPAADFGVDGIVVTTTISTSGGR